MSYFESKYPFVSYPLDSSEKQGLRTAQIGAIHAIAAHFTIYDNEPAIAIMPTGSGKTAVLILSAYVLRAKKVLVLTSNVLVRGQIFQEFSQLRTLKRLSVLKESLSAPKVVEVTSPIKSIEEWSRYSKNDVVIGLPNSINAGVNEEIHPNPTLFDLILVDEAHHVPAFTWSNIVKAFPNAKKVYFTATPFRRDKKEILGKIAFNYPLTKAYEDGIFGDIGYYAVSCENTDADLCIAKEAERIFLEDKNAGLSHYIMVRTESKPDAEKLDELYKNNTSLNLRKVDSSRTYSYITRTIDDLRKGDLDGIICVDMLGEGFDFPNLKIAAIHSPKKSLAATLQFIGRFARTNAEDIGEAKFIATPNEIEIGKRRLYSEGAIWNEIIRDLSEETIAQEDEIRTSLETFTTVERDTVSEPLSFYNINPYCHVKIFKVDNFNINASISLYNQYIVEKAISRENNTVVIITKELEKPKWIVSDELVNVSFNCYIVYYHEQSNLLFLNSTIKNNEVYEELVTNFGVGDAEQLPKRLIHKVLANITNAEFFNIGMKNRSPSAGESYRQLTGANTEKYVDKSSGRLYTNGHVFGKGVAGEQKITIGYSSGSKVWSNAYVKIPEFISWCNVLAEKITSNVVVRTNTGLDNLPIGEVIQTFPSTVHVGIFNERTFENPPQILILDDDTILETKELLDFDIKIDRSNSTEDRLRLELVFENIFISLSYDFDNHYQLLNEGLMYEVRLPDNTLISLIEYLNDNSLTFELDDLGFISDHEYFKPPAIQNAFDPARIIGFPWLERNTDITKEFYSVPALKAENNNKNSIHETLEEKLTNENPDVLLYDHGTGEIADFIAVYNNANSIDVHLYHVKGSGGEDPGDRVGDVYEVAMQAVKSNYWTSNRSSFNRVVEHRVNQRHEKFKRGNLASYRQIIKLDKPLSYTIHIVQPGLSQNTFSIKLGEVLASADERIVSFGNNRMVVWGSENMT